jgi:hypothetical protein
MRSGRSWRDRTHPGCSAPTATVTGIRRRCCRPQVVAGAWDAWRAEVEFAERFVAGSPSLDITGGDRSGIGQGQGPISLREVLLEMIHEYARHLGHADLLRERIDGRIGQ